MESINAIPTRENVEHVLQNFPLNRIAVMPVWIREKILIVPELKSTEIVGDTAALVQELYRREKYSTRLLIKKAEGSKVENIPKKNNHVTTKTNSSTEKKKDVYCRKNEKIVKEVVTKLGPDNPESDFLECVKQCDTRVLQEVANNCFKGILRPPVLKEKEDVLKAVAEFIDVLTEYVPSIRREKDPLRKLRTRIKNILKLPTSIGLFALLTHHVYWSVMHPLVKNVIKKCPKLNT